MPNVGDKDVKILVSRCNKLRVLDLGYSRITEKSLKIIIDNLKYTLEELDIRNTRIDIAHLHQLRSNMMPKLRILMCGGDYEENFDEHGEEDDFEENERLKELKSILPQLSITGCRHCNEDVGLKIAEIEIEGFLKINTIDYT